MAASSLVIAFLAAAPLAHELKDVSLLTSAGQTHLKLGFSPNGSEGDYPLYFQKTDMEKGTITLSFLETESTYPLGRHPLDGKAPDIEEILLKKITSPSGKNFLGVELKMKQPPMGDSPVQAAPKGVLKVMLGKGKGKFSWSLARFAQGRGRVSRRGRRRASPRRRQAEIEPRSGRHGGDGQGRRIPARTGILPRYPRNRAFPAPNPLRRRPGNPASQARQDPRHGLEAGCGGGREGNRQGRRKAGRERGGIGCVGRTREVGPSGRRGPGNAQGGQGAGAGKGLSSSRIFSVGAGSKTMVLLKDSASLKSAPGEKGKLIRKIPVGEKVEKIENAGTSLRVVSGTDTGFIRAADAVFEDEVTPAQEKASRIASRPRPPRSPPRRPSWPPPPQRKRPAWPRPRPKRKADWPPPRPRTRRRPARPTKLAKKKADAAAAKEAARLAAQQEALGLQESQAQARAAKQTGSDPPGPNRP